MKNRRVIPLIVGCVLLLIFLLAALFPGMFTEYGQKEMFAPWIKPSADHLLGTNALGHQDCS